MREAENKYISSIMKAETVKGLEVSMIAAISEDVPGILKESAVWAVNYILSWNLPYNGCRIWLPHTFTSSSFSKFLAQLTAG